MQAVYTTHNALLSVPNARRFGGGSAAGAAETTAARLMRDALLAATTGAILSARCMMPVLDKSS